MLAKQGGEEMGQRSHLTQLDIQKLNSLYYCGTSPPLLFYSMIPPPIPFWEFMGLMFTKVTLWQTVGKQLFKKFKMTVVVVV